MLTFLYHCEQRKFRILFDAGDRDYLLRKIRWAVSDIDHEYFILGADLDMPQHVEEGWHVCDFVNIFAMPGEVSGFRADDSGAEIYGSPDAWGKIMEKVRSAEKNGDFFLRSRLLFMRSEAYTALEEMISAFAKETGKKDIQVCYAYTVGEGADKESGLYDEAVTGLSVDINVYTAEGTFDIGHGSKKSVYYDWFAKNAAKYGFIMNGTSGHFRYVGVPHAVYMAENGLLLSEYLEKVREYGYMFPLSIKANGAEYDVYYVKAADGAITSLTIKNGAEYEISGDNISGFVITVKK
jgi:hypothetical protein